jgi:excisionase family DNA binding protein
MKSVFTTGEAAEICKVSQQTIIRCFDSGRLRGFRVPGSRFRRIPREALIQFMKDNGIPPDALDGGKQKILVVDDDPEIVELFVDVLERDGRFEVKTASTGYDAGMLTQEFARPGDPGLHAPGHERQRRLPDHPQEPGLSST